MPDSLPFIAEYVVRQYLYGQSTAPDLLTDRLRDLPPDASVEAGMIDGDAYMSGAARYAKPSSVEFVKTFFRGESGLAIGTYTVTELLGSYSPALFRFTYQNAEMGIGDADYMYRSFVFGHVGFSLAPDTKFIVGANGALSMADVRLIPEDDNFDFLSTGLAQYLNDYLLQPRIDPSLMGRVVTWTYSEPTSRISNYSAEQYRLDLNEVFLAEWSRAAAVAAIGTNIFSYLDGLEDNGAFQNKIGEKYVLYDGQGGNVLSPDPGYGYILIGGTGDDTIIGGDLDDTIYGGEGNDVIRPGGGSNDIWGGDEAQKPSYADNDTVDYSDNNRPITIKVVGDSGFNTVRTARADGIDELNSIERIVGTSGRDYVSIVGQIATDTNLTIDANGGQGPSPLDTINLTRATGNTVSSINSDGTGYIKTQDSGGQINLLHFHTGIIGSDYDDNIVDNSSGNKQIDGGAGNDTITVGLGAAVIFGGSGDDVLNGGTGNDVLNGGTGANQLNGGGGSDLLISMGGDPTGIGVEVLDGGEGSDKLVVTGDLSGKVVLRGGAGDDLFSAVGVESVGSSGPVVIEFGVGSGHDEIIGGPAGTGNGRWGNILIDAASLSFDDVKIAWTPNVVGQLDDYSLIKGDMALIIKSTGESILFRDVTGARRPPPGGSVSDPVRSNNYTSGTIFVYDLPVIKFSNGTVIFVDGISRVDFDMIGAAAYDLAAAAYAGAVAEGAGPQAGGESADSLSGTASDDVLSGGGGDDAFEGTAGTDDIDGGSGSDTLDLFGRRTDYAFSKNGAGDVVVTDLRDGSTTTIRNIESIYFSHDNEQATVADLFPIIGTGSGGAVLFGTSGHNVLVGTIGADIINGGGGDDVIDGRDGFDIAGYAGSSEAFAVGTAADGSIVVMDLTGAEGIDRLTAIEALKFAGDNVVINAEDVVPFSSFDGGDEAVIGTDRNDLIMVDGPVTVDGGDGHDVLYVDGISINARVFRDVDGTIKLATTGGYVTLVNVEALYYASDQETLSLTDLPALGTTGTDTLNGTNRSDYLIGNAGNDLIKGNGGSDHIWDSAGDDDITGGSGDDFIEDESGNDIYHYRRGDGSDEILDSGGFDKLLIDTGITASSVFVTTSASGEDVVLGFVGRPDTIVFLGMGTDATKGIDEVRFADGTTWSRTDLLVKAGILNGIVGDVSANTLIGTAGSDAIYGLLGNDTLRGLGGNDVLVGGAGNDTVTGGSGDDTYHFSANDGEDIFDDYGDGTGGSGGADKIILGAGILPSAVSIAQANAGGDLVLTFAGSSDRITISGALLDENHRIEQVQFADGTIWSHADLLARSTTPTLGNDIFYGDENGQTLQGGAGNDTLYGRAGDDILIGGVGNDTLDGGAGSDTYRFASGDGQDFVSDTRVNGDTNMIEFGAGIALNEVLVGTADAGHDIVFFRYGTERVTVDEMNADAARGIDGIRFADGTTWSYAQIMARRYTNGDDVITGTSSDELLYGAGGNDTLKGLAGNDELIGWLGNDTVIGGGGDDVYRFSAGDGQDIFDDYGDGTGGSGGADKIILGAGILPSAVSIAQANAGGDLVLTFAGSSDRITISGALLDANHRIEQVQFADGTIWSHADLLARSTTPTLGNDIFYGDENGQTLQGGAGNDTLYGRAGDDILIGGVGNDTLDGGAGSDTYRFASGDGQDFVSDTRVNGDTNMIEFGAGIALNEVLVGTADAGHDIVFFRYGTERVTVDEMNADAARGIDGVRFADGTTWSYAQIMARRYTNGDDVITGTSSDELLYGAGGNDTLKGLAGNDELIGWLGNDTVIGGGGDDIYRFSAGDGQDIFDDYGDGTGGSGGADKIILGAGILSSAVSVAQANAGSDLVLTFAGSSDRITISGALLDANHRIEQVQFADGTIWSHADLLARSTTPTSGNDIFYGDENGQTLQGGAGNDTLYGRAGDDILIGGAGNDTLDGGVGTDTAHFAGVQADYQLNTANGVLSITDLAPAVGGDDGTDQLLGVETAQFSDRSVSLASPVILDLNGDGVALLDNGTTNVAFDWEGDGILNQTGWVGGDDGFLVFDRDGNGTVTNGGELSFMDDKPGAKSDLDGLGAFDSNGDGIFSSDDEKFDQFKVWRDRNGNGRADSGEVVSLGDTGIASINLAGEAVNRSWAWGENVTVNTGSYMRTDGTTAAFGDVALSHQVSPAPAIGSAGPDAPRSWRDWLSRRYDLPYARMPISSLIDSEAGAQFAAIQRDATRLAETVASFSSTAAFGSIAADRDGSYGDETAFAGFHPIMERSFGGALK